MQWVLWLYILVSLPDQPERWKATLIEHYATFEACQTEQVRIAADMRLAYPNDPTFYFNCLERGQRL